MWHKLGGTNMRTGFIGTGAITEAIVIGLYTLGGYSEPIVVSRRSRGRSTILAERFPLVEVVDDKQILVDRCDQVFISVLPKQAVEVFSQLRFAAHHRVVSLVAGLSLETIASLTAPASSCFRAIPMPPIEYGLGPTPLCPPDSELESLFNSIGNAVPVDDESLFSAFASSSATMATFFDLVAVIAKWMEVEGVSDSQSTLYVTSMMHALATLTTRVDAENLQLMSLACLTPGGLNEQVLRGCQSENWTDTVVDQLDKVRMRLA